MKKENTTEKVTDIDYAQCAVPAEGRKGFLTMFMIMLGFTFFSASMWVGQQLAEGLDFYGLIKSLILGGMILGLYTGLLGYVGAKTGLSMDLLAKRAFGEKGSYISSAMISFTQIGWFGVGVAMFAIPVANELLGGSNDLVGAEIEMLNLPNREKVLTGILSPMKGEYDYILIDCSPSLGLITVNALTAADAVIIPVQCEYFALEGNSRFL